MVHLDTTIFQRVTWISSITLVTIAVFLQSVIGIDWSTILLVPGVVMMTAYFTSKGLTRQRPKYLTAKGRLLTSIWIMAVGGIVVVLSELPAVLSSPGTVNITLKAFGTIVMIGACALFIISLWLAKTNEPLAF